MEDKRAQYGEDEIITLEFDDGVTFDCGMMGTFELDGKEYIALEALDDSDDVYLYGYQRNDTDFDLLDDTTLVLQQEQGDALATPVQQTGTQAEYFAQMRLSRQTARDEAVELLQETIAYADGDAASSAKLEGIISDALAESQIESLIVAKGYQDCVAYISEDGISVAVAAPEDGLTQSDVALLSDIVLSQTSCKLSDIRVIGVEPEKGQ